MSQKSPIVKILARCHFCLSTLFFTTAQVMFITAKIMCMFFLSVNFVCFSIRYMNLIVTCYLLCKNIWQEWKRLSFGFSSFSSSSVILRCLFLFYFYFFLIKEPRKKALNREQADLGKVSLLKLTMNKLIKL